MIDHLTDDQIARLPLYRDEGLAWGLSTEPADRPRAEAGVRLAYQTVGLDPPSQFVWLRSPLEGAIGASLLNQVGDQVKGQVGGQVWGQVKGQVWGQVRDQVKGQVRDQVGGQVWDQVWKAIFGQHDASWLGFYRVFRDLGVSACERLQGLEEVCRSCSWWWAFEHLAILTDRPQSLYRDPEHRLHNDRGPALSYRDDWGIYAWHGLRVSQQIIEAPATLTLKDIQSESNIEIKRIMIQRWGEDRYIRETGSLPIATDQWGTLYRAPIDQDEPLMMVRVENSTLEPDGSRRPYWIKVHPELRPLRRDGSMGDPQPFTVKNAIASTFGLRGEDYNPEAEA